MNKFVKQSFGYVLVFKILQARKLSLAATLAKMPNSSQTDNWE
jgi:hypothetical protein